MVARESGREMISADQSDFYGHLIAEVSDNRRAIGIPLVYIQATGYLERAAVLQEVVFWSGWARRKGRTGGWFYRTNQEWQERTALSQYQLSKAVKALAVFGVETKLRKVTDANGTARPVLHYRLNMDAFATTMYSILKKLDNQETSISKDSEETSISKDSEETSISSHTEKTTEKTQRGTGDPRSQSPSSEGETPAKPKRKPREATPEQQAQNQQAIEIVHTFTDLSGIQPANFPKAIGQAKQLVKAGMNVDDARTLYRWLETQKWINGGIDMGMMVSMIDRWRAATSKSAAPNPEDLYAKRREKLRETSARMASIYPESERQEPDTSVEGWELMDWTIYGNGDKSTFYGRRVR